MGIYLMKLNLKSSACAHGEHQHSHKDGLFEELMHHIPYAIFSVALSMVLLSILCTDSIMEALGHAHEHCHDHGGHHHGSYFDTLFHSFHFLHVLFAATGTVITFLRYSRSLLWAVVIGTCAPMIFCTLSDVLLPYAAGIILGVPMELHFCFHTELANVLPFLFVGICNGLVLRLHHSGMLNFFSLGSHFVHILISSLASLFYMVSHGFHDWSGRMGILYLFIVLAIVLPCTLSDIIVPMYFAKITKR